MLRARMASRTTGSKEPVTEQIGMRGLAGWDFAACPDEICGGG